MINIFTGGIDMKKLSVIMAMDNEHLMQNYPRFPVCFSHGSGPFLYDINGKRYIDFFSGIAVTNLGHGHPSIKKAMHAQVDRLIHTSNWYFNAEQAEAARLLTEASFPGKTIFTNSGAEANEAAIKLVRKFGIRDRNKRHEIITFRGSFHGRTFGSMSATAQGKIHDGFGPIVHGFKYAPFNDIKSFRRAVDKNTAGVMIELIQGESGIRVAEPAFIQEMFSICSKNGIVTVIDEVQTGMGRTGTMFAYQRYGIVPDIITLAKGLGGGAVIGAVHSKNHIAECFSKGVHGTTFGGNHLACAASIAVFNEMKKPGFFKKLGQTSELFFKSIESIKNKSNIIKEVRGAGLHIGIELTEAGSSIVSKALEHGLMINCAAERVIRVMPPLNIPHAAAKAGLKILERILTEEKPK
jgi:acetylornithine/N-succinyldiaminopimelate aminotransferase